MTKKITIILFLLLFVFGYGMYKTCSISNQTKTEINIETDVDESTYVESTYVEKNMQEFDDFIIEFALIFIFIICPVVFWILIL